MYIPTPDRLRGTLYDPRTEHDACGVGMVVDIAGRRSNRIVRQALTALANMRHRGALGAEPNTGDGAGILMQIPDAFLRRACAVEGIALPEPGAYAAGMVFLPPDPRQRADCERRFEAIIRAEGLDVLGWRTVPTDGSMLGKTARATEPVVRQIFIRRGDGLAEEMALERKLFIIRRLAEKAIRYPGLRAAGRAGEEEPGAPDGRGNPYFYICSLSARTMVYKGMLTAPQLQEFYADLREPDVESAIALVHARFSTNTFPSWARAQPLRYMLHNGEINTIRGNQNWMYARQGVFRPELSGLGADDLARVLPVINPDGSDSAMFDNSLEFLTLAGRSLPHTVMMMIPEPWTGDPDMPDEKRAFYEFHSCLMEPWDGPASIAFTDGRYAGAVLDRNGLRPSRYTITADGLLVLASEVGVLDIPASQVIEKGRLRPGRMLLVDTEAGRLISDAELKQTYATAQPYREWLKRNLVELDKLPEPSNGHHEPEREPLVRRQLLFGYTFEDLNLILAPMARDGVEPIGSMGNDTPPAVLSDKPQLLYAYFKQLFAQVTNPPLDGIREEIVTSKAVALGAEGDLLRPGPQSCRQVTLKRPILDDGQAARLRTLDLPGLRTRTLPAVFPAADGAAGLERALDALFDAADRAIGDGASILIISDRQADREHAPIPALLALAGLHHHLIRTGTRTQVGLVVESGEPREVHHFALLIGYGAGAIYPYLALETLRDMVGRGQLPGMSYEQAAERFITAIVKGVLKVISKMGISTVDSYRGAQVFEALGLHRSVIDRYFTWTASRIGGAGLEVIAAEALRRHERAFGERTARTPVLEAGGNYQWRHGGEHHQLNPVTVHKLQQACRLGDYGLFREYSALVTNYAPVPATLRALLDLDLAVPPVPIEEVEPVEAIVRRFKTGGMSYGSISPEAHQALAIAMNRLGGKSNSGEGGEDPARYIPLPNGDSRSSAIKQVASARFGVTSLYLTNARELQIKIAQGAKPGEGGQLPGRKVYPWIARVRHSTPGVGLISPPPHHDIYSIEDLAELIYNLKNANPQARITVKLVSEVGVGTIAAGVAKGHADVILISGYDGGTGASPQTGIKHAGLPWELGLSETHQTLLANDLRSRVVLETDGQLRTGRDVVIGALLGAEEFGFATGPLVTLGCTMMRVCHLDTCPVGVATQNPELRKHFSGDPAYVVNFMRFVAQEVRELMAQLGFRTFDELIGRTDRLVPRPPNGRREGPGAFGAWKAQGVDLSALLARPEVPPEVGRRSGKPQEHGMEQTLDRQVLIPACEPALSRGERVHVSLPIGNANRSVGTMLGSEVTRRYGAAGLPDDTIRLDFAGSAGQSFGAFLPRGITLTISGDCNDYVGKGLSGGKIVVSPPADAAFTPEENIIIGNVALYGATSGELYVRGVAGERFAVRNSGAQAVVEGIGDHGCEYMTGGRVVVLGPTGRNFAAGMSGGIAYVLDEAGDFGRRCNREMVGLEPLERDEAQQVQEIIERHTAYTDSRRARDILNRWDELLPRFVKVMPVDYRRMLEALEWVQGTGLSGEQAEMAAFEANKNDALRVSGN
jgi:glutamate synthase (NADPH/NADH) large chain